MSIKSYQSTVYESSHEVYFQVFSNILRIPNQVLLDWWNTLKQSHKLYNLRHNTSQLTSSFSSLNIFIYYKKTCFACINVCICWFSQKCMLFGGKLAWSSSILQPHESLHTGRFAMAIHKTSNVGEKLAFSSL